MKTLFYVTPFGYDCDGMQSTNGYCFYSELNANKCADNMNNSSDGINYSVSTSPFDNIEYWWAGVWGI